MDFEFLAGTLRGLTPPERGVFVLHDVLGWRVDDIADLFGTTVGSVAETLWRARQGVCSGSETDGPDAA